MRKYLAILALGTCLATNAMAADNYGDLSTFPKWKHITSEAPLKFAETRAVGLKDLERINTLYNTSITYKPDKEDYWQTPTETDKLGTGDCEDYAIEKYYALAELGVDPKDMLIVVGYHYLESDIHAVLQVKLKGKAYVLDLRHHKNEADDKLKDARKYYNTEFSPAYGINHVRWTRKPLN